MRHVFLFVNGILTSPGNARAWTDRAVQWMNVRPAPGQEVVSDKFEYFSPALLRRLFQGRHARELAYTLSQYQGARLHLVGHSNGCDLIARAIARTQLHVSTVHLIAAAIDRDFRKNGFGPLLASGQVGACFCFCSLADTVLTRWARASRLATFGLLGYGDLGAYGAAEPWPRRVHHVVRSGLGHSDWFAGGEFDRTLQSVLYQALFSAP